MGVVYKAHDKRLDRVVALKVLPAEMAEDAERLERFRREARAVAALNHPNIVTIFAVDEADGVPFLAMEFIEGQTLDEVTPVDGLPLSRFFELAIPIADALHRRFGSPHHRGNAIWTGRTTARRVRDHAVRAASSTYRSCRHRASRCRWPCRRSGGNAQSRRCGPGGSRSSTNPPRGGRPSLVSSGPHSTPHRPWREGGRAGGPYYRESPSYRRPLSRGTKRTGRRLRVRIPPVAPFSIRMRFWIP